MEHTHNTSSDPSQNEDSEVIRPESVSGKNNIVLKRVTAEDNSSLSENVENEEKMVKPSMIKESVLTIDYSLKEKSDTTEVLKESKKKNVSDSHTSSLELKKQNSHLSSSKYSKDGRGKLDDEEHFFTKEQIPTSMSISKSNIDTYDKDNYTQGHRNNSATFDSSQNYDAKKSSGVTSFDNRHQSTFADFRTGSILDFSAKPSRQKSGGRRTVLTSENNVEYDNDENEEISQTTESKFLKSKSRNAKQASVKLQPDLHSQTKIASSSSNLQHPEDNGGGSKSKASNVNGSNTNTFTVTVDAHGFSNQPSGGHGPKGGKASTNLQVERKKVSFS